MVEVDDLRQLQDIMQAIREVKDIANVERVRRGLVPQSHDPPEFEALVDPALRKLPRAFRDKLANIAVVVEDWADDETLAEIGIEPPDTLYGLYRGIDITRRDSSLRQCPARHHPHLPGAHRGGLRRTRRRWPISSVTSWSTRSGHYFGLDDDTMEGIEQGE